MRVSWWRLWALGMAWVIGASIAIGVLIGVVFGFIVGIQTQGDAYSSGSVSSALLMTLLGAVMGAIYGIYLGLPTGTVATAIYAWVVRRQLLGGPMPAGSLRWQAAVIAAVVQAAASMAVVATLSGGLSGFAYIVGLAAIAAGVAAFAGPRIVRMTAGREAVGPRHAAAVMAAPGPSVD